MDFIEVLWADERVRTLFVIVLLFIAAGLIHTLSYWIVGRLINLNRFGLDGHRMRNERQRTLHGLLANLLSFLAFAGAIVASLALLAGITNVIWLVGLFSAAFGLGARPLVNDFLAGTSFIFEDTFDVGEKVEILGVEGVIERVTLRVTLLRAPTGELLTVPNGEIRLVRNFSRGRFSSVALKLKVPSEELGQVLALLEELGHEAMIVLPNLLEPWQILSETGVIGEKAELTLLTKARFGHAAEMRPRLLAFVQERLSEEGVPLLD